MVKIVTGWYDVPEYQMKIHSQKEFEDILESLSMEEKRVIAEQGQEKITAERLKWRRVTIDGKLGGSEEIFQQEFLESEERCFLVSGSPRFDMEGLIHISSNVRVASPKRKNGRLVEKDGKITFEECAKSEAEFQMWDEAPECIVVLEINNSGLAWVSPLKDAGVRLWRRKVYDTITGNTLRKIGWSTDQKSREIIISALADAIRAKEEGIVIPCSQLSSQLQTFVRDKTGKPQASPGNHDDDVITTAMACELQDMGDLYEEKKKPIVESDYN